jgi:thiol-disulfide isomerase/thioredoxin
VASGLITSVGSSLIPYGDINVRPIPGLTAPGPALNHKQTEPDLESSPMPTEFKRDRRRILGATALTALATLSWGVVRLSGLQLHAEGELPSLHGATGWLNSPALASNDLRGKVTLIDFWTYSCINWRRSLPYLRAWSQKYKADGLVMIGVHSPEFPFERDAENVRRAAATMRIDYPIALDNDFAVWRAFNNEFWPALYFVDGKGRIRHHQFGEGDYDRSEQVIQQLLGETGTTGFNRALISANAAGAELPADWQDLKSEENYLGYERTQNFQSHGGAASNRPHNYESPAKLAVNHWALSGDWTSSRDEIVMNSPNGRIAYQFHARDLHLVMGPANKGGIVRFRVSIDGQSPGDAHGVDVDGEGNGTVIEPQLYQLIRQSQPIVDRRFEIEFLEPGIQAYSFTFG